MALSFCSPGFNPHQRNFFCIFSFFKIFITVKPPYSDTPVYYHERQKLKKNSVKYFFLKKFFGSSLALELEVDGSTGGPEGPDLV